MIPSETAFLGAEVDGTIAVASLFSNGSVPIPGAAYYPDASALKV
jgi:hypothetical protein